AAAADHHPGRGADQLHVQLQSQHADGDAGAGPAESDAEHALEEDHAGWVRTDDTGGHGARRRDVASVQTQYAPCACSPLGKMSRVSQPYAPGATPVWTSYTYDGSGRTLTVTAPDGSATHYAYLGNT